MDDGEPIDMELDRGVYVAEPPRKSHTMTDFKRFQMWAVWAIPVGLALIYGFKEFISWLIASIGL